jgi:predicted transcriptional regulator
MSNKGKSASTHGLEKFLGELEMAVMEVVWEFQPVSVAAVLNQLNSGERTWAYTTIMTIMSRLATKGWLVTEKQGRALIYHAAQTREEAEVKMAGDIVRNLLADFGEVAIAQVARELDRLDPSQLVRLADLARTEYEEKTDHK